MKAWIGIDLDGTLAEYHGWVSREHIGAPVKTVVNLALHLLNTGRDVRIFTARISDDPDGVARAAIEAWCQEHLGRIIPITNVKDYGMVMLYDDRVVAVEKNTGNYFSWDEGFFVSA